MSIKKWVLSSEDTSSSSILAQECGVSDFVAEILMNRGYKTFEKASQFVENSDEIASPLDIADMQEAVNRIQEAIENCEKVAIYGDYDCDGITSTAMLYMYFQTIGLDVIYYIPERDGEGYGLNNAAIDNLNEKGVTLIVTVDNGISAFKQVSYAKKLGIDMVITDHHQPPEEIPNACAVVDPHRKDCKSIFKDLCGVGVAFKLIATLEGDVMAVLESFGDIVALGTIADIVPLISENRILVNYGIKMLKMTDNLGLKALIKVASLNVEKLTSRDVAFMLVPRINAAGRMGNASKAVELLTCESEEIAEKLALELDALNRKRKEEEQQIIEDISNMLKKKPDALNQRVLMFYNEKWNHGIIGIICSKLVEKYSKPVIMMTKDNDIIKGSARSIGDFNLYNALNANAKFLTQYGGHKRAGGFSLLEENLNKFKINMQQYAKNKFDIMPCYEYFIDKKLRSNEITVDIIKSLDVFEPFGCNNEQPLFLIANAKIEKITPISNDKHLKITLNYDGQSIDALYFGMESKNFNFSVTSCVSVLCYANINEYNQKLSVSLKIKDIRPYGFNQKTFFTAKSYYEKIKNAEILPKDVIRVATPTRKDIANIYKWIKSRNGFNGDIDVMYFSITQYNINYCKMRIILDILNEMQLIILSPSLDNISLIEVKEKVDLTQSKLLKKLSSLL